MAPLATMPRILASTFALLVLAFGLALGPAPAAAQTSGYSYRPGEILIKFKPGTSQTDIHAILNDLGASPITDFPLIGASHDRITRLDVAQAIARYQGDPRIQYIEPNYILHTLGTPNDPLFGQMWGLSNTGQTGGIPGADIHAIQAWDIFTGSPNVLVAIIDSGTDYNHPDLAANIYVNPGEIPGNGIDDDGNGFIDDVHGWNFAYNTNDPMDDLGHGTHVSGTVGAIGNNALGVVGVNWNVKLLPVKFLDSGGFGTTAGAISSIAYATMMGAKVMSNSWGGGPYEQSLYDAIKAAGEAGALFVAAAGNSSTNNDVNPAYPASYDLPNIVSVAASDPTDHLAYFSNYGATSVDLAAPGTDILSTLPGASYGYLSGTSMATPHVSGAAALVFGRYPGIDAMGVKNLLLADVDPLPTLAGKVASGGRLNAFLPLAGIDSVPPDPITDVGVSQVNGDWVELHWTATGDDGATGTAARYDVRFSTAPITEANFGAATPASGLPHPLPAGSAELVRVNGLNFSTTYYFAVKALDELGNASGLSNVVSGTTLGPPIVGTAPDSLVADLLTGAKATRVLTISNTGASELRFQLSSRLIVTAASRPAAGLLPAAGPRPASPARRAGMGSTSPPYDQGATPPRAPLIPGPLPPTKPTVSGLRVLLLESGGDVSELRNVLLAFPDIAQVDVFDGGSGSPTLAQLSAYNTVIPIANIRFADPDAIGNVLADYVDAGGGVVLTLATFINGWEIGGRLLSGGYFPFLLGSGPGPSSTLGAFDPTHPIMQGVKTASGDLLGIVTMAPGAKLVASWASGLPMVATKGPRVAAVNLFFGGPGFWTGDVPLLMRNAAFWAGGVPNFLTIDPATGTVPPGGSAQVQVTFDSAQLFGGDYFANVSVESNDPVTPVALVPAHLHVTGAPDIAVNPASLDFGKVFIGYARPETVTVVNRGTDVLSVSGVSATPGDFAVPGAAFDLVPGAAQMLVVTFSPTSAAVIPGSLSITSNDPDQGSVTVALTGEGLVPPAIGVTPDSLVADLLSGQTSTQALTIRNTGGSDLTFSVGAAPALAAARAGRALGPPRGATRPAVPGLASLLAAPRLAPSGAGSGAGASSTASSTAAAGAAARSARPRVTPSSVPPTGNDMLVIATTPIDYSLGLALQQLGKAYDLQLTEDFTTIDFTPYKTIVVGMDGGAVNEASCQALANAAAAGRLVFMMGGTNYVPFYNGVQTYLLSHTGMMGWVVSAPPHLIVTNPSDPLAVGLPPTTTFATPGAAFYMLRISDPAAAAVASNGDGHPALVHKAIGAGSLVYLIDSAYEGYWGSPGDFAVLKQIVQNVLAFGSASWLSVTPRTGTVPAGGEVTLQVGFNSAGLQGGDYRANITILSNDPAKSLVAVPAHMHVTGVPRIAVSPPSIDFGSVFTGHSKLQFLAVSNVGTDLLTVSGLTVSPGDYSVPTGGFSLAPGQAETLVVVFTPGSPVPIPGTIGITSDDPVNSLVSVPLSGVGLVPPKIAVTPPSLSASLLSGQQVTQPLDLSNTGGSDLLYSIAISPVTAPARVAGAARGAARGAAAGPIGVVAGARLDGQGLFPPIGPSGLEPLLRQRLARVAGKFVVFFDDMEHGDNGWTRQVYGIDDLWHRTTRAYNSPVTSWWCGLESSGNYNTGNTVNTAAVSPLIDLTLFQAPLSLEFYENFQTEPNFDFCMVDVSTDGGVTWTPLRGGLGAAPSGSSGGWRLTGLDLSSFAGKKINIRFYFDTIDPIANNYPGWFFDDVLVSAAGVPWLTVAPASGTVPAGGSQPLQATFDAGTLIGGDYRAEIRFVSNDPDQPLVAVPAQLHVTGVPNIAVIPTSLDFHQVFAGGARAESLIVSNIGTDVLTVTSIDVVGGAFSAPTAGFSLPIGGAQPILVTFAPPAVGTFDGTITVHSNDPDQGAVSVALHGQGIDAPNVAVFPPIFQEVMMPDELLNESLSLKNLGGGPLTWTAGVSFGVATAVAEHQAAVRWPVPAALGKEVALVPPPPPAAEDQVRWGPAARALARAGLRAGRARTGAALVTQPPLAQALAVLDSGYAFVTAAIPNRYDFLEGESGTSIVDGGQDMYDGGNFLQTELGGPIPYTNGLITSHPAVGSGGAYFTRKYPGLFLLAADLKNVQYFTITGDLGADGAGSADGAILEADIGGTHFRAVVKRVFGANGKPSVNHLFILPDPGTTTHGYSGNTNSDFDQVGGLAPPGRIYYLLFATQGGTYIDDTAMAGIIRAFLGVLFPSPPWLSVNPAAGVLPGHSSTALGVLIDSHGLALGNYDAQILLRSDDPDQPLVTVPVSLTLGGPTAIEITLVSSSADPGVARLKWYTPQGATSATVYRHAPDRDWEAVGSITADGTGYMLYEDRSVAAGGRYGYRLGITENGSERFLAESWIDVPASATLALEGLRPNPAVHDVVVAFSLPDAAPANLALIDLAGRLVRSQEIGAQGAGRHVISLGRTASLPAGLYLLRLQHGGQALVTKCVIMP